MTRQVGFALETQTLSLFGTTTPPMPGHPERTVDPVQTARTLSAARVAGVPLVR
jgi:hypothetical protein